MLSHHDVQSQKFQDQTAARSCQFTPRTRHQLCMRGRDNSKSNSQTTTTGRQVGRYLVDTTYIHASFAWKKTTTITILPLHPRIASPPPLHKQTHPSSSSYIIRSLWAVPWHARTPAISHPPSSESSLVRPSPAGRAWVRVLEYAGACTWHFGFLRQSSHRDWRAVKQPSMGRKELRAAGLHDDDEGPLLVMLRVLAWGVLPGYRDGRWGLFFF
jgi:hypothetical protein